LATEDKTRYFDFEKDLKHTTF